LTDHKTDLDSLLTTLDVDVVRMTECLVNPGWRLSFRAIDLSGLHYNLSGYGSMSVGDAPPIDLTPHTLVIIPAGKPFHIEVAEDDGTKPSHYVVAEPWSAQKSLDSIETVVAGDDEHEVQVICGYFRASYGVAIDLFATQSFPIVQRFGAKDDLAQTLRSVLGELHEQQVGKQAMTSALVKQLVVALLRRSLAATDSKIE
jgi:Cupin